MKTHFFKRGIAGLLSLVMCLSAFIGLGTTTAFAAGEQAEVYLISFPRSGDANLDYSGTWGHSNLHYMNGWYSGESKYTTIRAMHSYDGNICYCIEPGTPQDTGDRYTSKDETFWDNLPSDFNSTISPYDMKLFIGRIMQYGYTGPISTSWRSQNASDAETLAQAMATQVLIWETVVGERDEDFNHISPGSYDAVKSVVSTAHPLYSQFISYYNSIEASVQRHSAIPSFMAKTPGKAQNVELAWNGTNYTATLTDSNNVLSNYSFSANEDGISFSVSGNKLVITAATAPSDSVRITASKSGATRRGIITWTDGRYAPGSGIQDVISYAQEVNDPVQAFLNLKVWIPSGTPSKRKRIRACNGRRRNSNGKAGDFMPYIPPEVVEQARQIDLLTYLQSCEPQELVRISGNNYTTRTHDSLKISNGKWMWWSQRIGGYNALDYLVKVKGCSFIEAVETLMGKAAVMPTVTVKPKQKTEPKILLLPDKSASTEKITEYLFSRGIDYSIIQYCIDKGLIFESLPYHNLVCVGFDDKNTPRYASFRATNDRRVLGDCSGSDKHYSFRVADSDSSTVHLFECAIDLLSYATLAKMAGRDWRTDSLVSLAGVYLPKEKIEDSTTPAALVKFLDDKPQIQKIFLHFDNDNAGRKASLALKTILPSKYEVIDSPPPCGKDYNDFLCFRRGIHRNKTKERTNER